MAITWIVSADSARAKVLQVADRGRELAEVEDLLNPKGHLHEGDLVTDTDEPTDAVEHSVDLFSKRVGEYLEKARTEHRYDKLVLVAPPKFLGKLRKQLGKEVQKLVADELDKDLYRANARELEAYFSKGSGRAP
jgi:protein required for attachment to host cells